MIQCKHGTQVESGDPTAACDECLESVTQECLDAYEEVRRAHDLYGNSVCHSMKLKEYIELVKMRRRRWPQCQPMDLLRLERAAC